VYIATCGDGLVYRGKWRVDLGSIYVLEEGYLKKNIISLAKLPDSIISKVYLKLFEEKSSLSTFLFHGLFCNEKEIALNLVDPQPWIFVEQFRQFVEYYLDHDYTFVSPDDVLHGLKDYKKYVMVTFDDGYFNNQYALPILKEYKIPAVFFISTSHVKHNKCFWWDVIYRERKELGTSTKEIIHEQNMLKTKTNKEIEKYLMETFGENVLKPRGDIDRPFTPSELKDFSKENYVFLGNHTSDHAILTNYSPDEIRLQILDAQNVIHEITGTTPIAISYPNGNYSDEIIRISKENGFKLGVTAEYGKNYLPIDGQAMDCMRLGRFDISGSDNVLAQCELFRSDVLLYPLILNVLKRT